MQLKYRSINEKGFSLLELLIVLGIFAFVLGGLFTSLNKGQTRFQFEQDVLEAQQAARNAVDLMEREMKLAGYPRVSHYDSALGYTTASSEVSAGFTQITSTSMTFEGDINEDAQVESVSYRINSGVLERSAVAKGSAASYQQLAGNVAFAHTVFSYYDDSGATTATLTSIKSVGIDLRLSTNGVDPETGHARTVSVTSRTVVRN